MIRVYIVADFAEDLARPLLQLQTHQFERASEVLLSSFVEEWLSEQLEADLRLITMEFPIKQEGTARSNNADYLFFSSKHGGKDPKWLLVEVKTELTPLAGFLRR